MGISGLTKLIGDHACKALKENDIKNYFGRKIAIDASMSIYQFLISVRQEGNMLMSETGEATSHLMGMFYRTIRMVDAGIKPVYVFDGKPPQLKSLELSKRLEKRKEATKDLDNAQELGDVKAIDKFSRRTVKITKEHNEECKRLLQAMGIPYVDAPGEAEAQCAALCKAGKVFATASEDMDSLTFDTPLLLRHLTFSEARKMSILEIHLNEALQGLELTREQFIDLCILLGCDYCEPIRGIGPHRALQLIKQYKTLDEIVSHLDTNKYPIPQNWPYAEVRQLFIKPDIKNPDEIELKWDPPEEEEVVKFLVHEKGFNEERVRNAMKRLAKAHGTATQIRLDGFFKVSSNSIPQTTAGKRKEAASASKKSEPKKKIKS
jgi:flap endonuclease-1